MNKDLEINFLKMVPMDVIMNHIMPFTYEPKPPRHMNDIRSYYSDYQMIINYYYYDLNEYILLRDIVNFYNNNQPLDNGIEHSFTVKLNRNIRLQQKSLDEKCAFIFFNYKDNITVNAENKIKFLWGLLKPHERTTFINKYVIEYLEKIE